MCMLCGTQGGISSISQFLINFLIIFGIPVGSILAIKIRKSRNMNNSESCKNEN